MALLVPVNALWPTVQTRRARVLLAAIAVVVFAMYAFYMPFDAWWFLRLLLPCWPALCIGTAAFLSCASQFAGSRGEVEPSRSWLGLYTAFTASRLRVFPDNEGERRYATIAQLVQQTTEPSSMILASIHTGPIRYYAGRDTMRFDLLNEEWLDRAVAWLTEHGRHPYILIEDWERPIFEKRFAATTRLAASRCRQCSPIAPIRFPARSTSSIPLGPRRPRGRRRPFATRNPGVPFQPRLPRWRVSKSTGSGPRVVGRSPRCFARRVHVPGQSLNAFHYWWSCSDWPSLQPLTGRNDRRSRPRHAVSGHNSVMPWRSAATRWWSERD